MSIPMRPIFRINDKDFTPIFITAIDIVESLLLNEKNCMQLFGGLARKYPAAENKKKKLSDTEIHGAICKTLMLGVDVRFTADKGTVMQLQAASNTLFLNVQYLFCNSGDIAEKNRCLLILINKILHELAHALTNTFYELMGHIIEYEENGFPKFLFGTPVAIGQVIKGNQKIGDNGYGLEEGVFKCRLNPGKDYTQPLVLIDPDYSNLLRSDKYTANDADVATAVAALCAAAQPGGVLHLPSLVLFTAKSVPFKRQVATKKRKRGAAAHQQAKKKQAGNGLIVSNSSLAKNIDKGSSSGSDDVGSDEESSGEEGSDKDDDEDDDEDDPFSRLVFAHRSGVAGLKT